MKLGGKKFLKFYLVVLFLAITIFPKVTLIAIPGSHAGIRLEDLMIAGYLIFFFINGFKNGFGEYKKLSKIVRALCLCLAAFAISNIVGCISGNVTPYLAIFYLVRVFEYFVLIFAGRDLISIPGGKRLLLNLIKATVVFHGIYAILEYFSLTPDISALINRPTSGRVFTTFSGPYELAGYLAICLPLILNEIFVNKKYTNVLFAVLIFTSVILSESRIALVAITVVTIMWVLKAVFGARERGKGLSPLKVLASALVLAVVAIGVVKGLQSSRFAGVDFGDYVNTTISAWEHSDYDYYRWNKQPYYSPLVFSQTDDRSFALRITKWTVLIKQAVEVAPLFGLGMSISGEAMDGGIVKLFCETGMIGLILWIILMVTVWKQARNNKKISFVVLSMIAVLFINAIFIDIFDASKVMMAFWFIVGYYIYIDSDSTKNTQKKILILSDNNLNTLGGSQQSITTMTKELVASGYCVGVFMADGKDNSCGENEARIFTYRKYKNKIVNFIFMYGSLLDAIREFEPDIVHAQNTKVIIAAGIMGKTQRIDNVNYIMTDRMFLNEYRPRTKKLLTFLSSGFDLIITTTSKNQLEWAKVVGNEKVMVVTNALDDYWFKYDEEDEKRIKRENGVKGFNIGFSGRYEEYKRWDVVLEICNALKKYPDIQFTVAITADEAYRDEMKKFVSDLKRLLRKKLKLFIDMPKENMGSFYYMLDIFVLTSRNESFGRVLIEAMTKNNIVLGTDSGGVPDILEKKFLYDVGDYQGAVNKILAYYENSTLANREKQYFLNLVKRKYTAGNMTKNLIVAYNSVFRAKENL
ncbi:glycosyltransferase [Candidatus Saccharibacteria bacterium]|nr:glycosyltransferase [Candidatus Saccharibacteria bacterium]